MLKTILLIFAVIAFTLVASALEFPGGEHRPESWKLADGMIFLFGKR